MASDVYANAKLLMATDTLGWVDPAQTFRGMLMTAAYTFNFVQTTVSDVVASEVSGGTYSRVDITSRTAVLDLGGNRALLDAANAQFPALTGVTPSGLIIYKQIGGNDLSPDSDLLICFVDFLDTGSNGSDFFVEFDSSGVIALTTC